MYEILKTVYPKMLLGFYLTTSAGLVYRSTREASQTHLPHLFSHIQMWME